MKRIEPLQDPGAIVDMASAYYGSAALFAALEWRIFERLALQPDANLALLAAQCGANERGLRLLLDSCVALGLLEKHADRYRNSPAAAMALVPGAKHDLTKAIRYNQDVYIAWGRAAELVRNGKPVEASELHLGDDPARTRNFVHAMYGRALGIGRAVAPMLDLTGARRLLDVGGGSGAYAMLLAQAAPALHATVLELPAVAAIGRELMDATDVADRITMLPGDYHTTPFPDGQDIVTFFGVLHQEPAQAIGELLRRAFAALRHGGRIYVLDMMTDASHTQPQFAALFALNMALTTPYGWVFAECELEGWLREAGFVEIEIASAPPPMPHRLMMARKPSGA